MASTNSTNEQLSGPVPGGWYGSDLAKNPDAWRVPLPAEVNDDLLRAADALAPGELGVLGADPTQPRPAVSAPRGRRTRNVRGGTDSVGFTSMYQMADNDSAWVTRYLWTGAVPYLGPPAISLVGSADDIVDAIFEYRDIGITEFPSTGFPDLEQMRFATAEVLPRVRERERTAASTSAGRLS
jgi:hypothetical protein